MSIKEVTETGISQGLGRAIEKLILAGILIGGILIGGYALIKKLKLKIPKIELPDIILGEPDTWTPPDTDKPADELFVDDPYIKPVVPAQPPDKLTVSGVNWLSSRCVTLQNNILKDLELEGTDKVWWIIPIPKTEDRWYDCARRIEYLRSYSLTGKEQSCEVSREEIYEFLCEIAKRNLGNRGRAARIVSRKYKTIYGRRW